MDGAGCVNHKGLIGIGNIDLHQHFIVRGWCTLTNAQNVFDTIK